MGKKGSLALGILSVLCLAGSVYVCVVETIAENFVLALIFLGAALYFFFHYKKLVSLEKIKAQEEKERIEREERERIERERMELENQNSKKSKIGVIKDALKRRF